jgi:FkbM family methyltransferase
VIKRSIQAAKYYGLRESVTDIYTQIKKRLKIPVHGKHYFLMPPEVSIPVCLRFSTSDNKVFHQVFNEKQYSCMDQIQRPQFILDCGANIGLSCIYFLNQFPDAYIVALEPDDDNYQLCVKNLQFYKDQVKVLKKAVWSSSTGLKLFKHNEGNLGSEWATEVRIVQEGEEPDVEAVDINTILKEENVDYIDILKIDIEHAEKYLFKDRYQEWLPKVKNLVIELHGEECERIFFNALKDYDYQLEHLGETIACKNLSYKNSAFYT